MKLLRIALAIGLIVAAPATASAARTWTDSTGQYSLAADLISMSDNSVVLQRADHELVAVPIKVLSEKDREYLQSQEAIELGKRILEDSQTWTLRDGTKLIGRAVNYASRDITIQRRRGHNFVNDRRFDNLPDFYQRLIPQIVGQLESLENSDRRAFEAWVLQQRGQARTFHLKGIAFETESGDEYAVPFFLLSSQDQSTLGAGFEEWLGGHRSDDHNQLDEIAFLLQSLAAARHHDQMVKRQIATLNLKLQAVNAGLVSLWEVTLYPSAAQGGPPLWVVGRNSDQATAAAIQQWPGFSVGPIRRLAN
jgi:hypothetical protein